VPRATSRFGVDVGWVRSPLKNKELLGGLGKSASVYECFHLIDSIYEVIGPVKLKVAHVSFLDPGRLSRAPAGRSSGPLTVFPDLHN